MGLFLGACGLLLCLLAGVYCAYCRAARKELFTHHCLQDATFDDLGKHQDAWVLPTGAGEGWGWWVRRRGAGWLDTWVNSYLLEGSGGWWLGAEACMAGCLGSLLTLRWEWGLVG